MDTSSEIQSRIAKLEVQSYSRVDLMRFTSNFLESNKIGSGGCGKVYKGQLPNGILIAVKVLEIMDDVKDTFMAEVSTMGKARHLNLIKLYGYCFEDNMKALVYEYMENGSLDKILYENPPVNNIEWVKLYDIVIGIANGLKYLHHDLEEQIIHYDIKAANVLLGKNFSAKLADFGLAKTMKRDVSRVDGSRIRGTHGYIAPEIYTPASQVGRKCDVYSFGMMLFEILGKRWNGVEENWFPKIVWKQFENGNLEHYITTDCGIVEKDKENANILCKVAFWCVQDDPDLRLSMKDVVLMLEKEKPVEDPPCPSPNFRGRSDETELYSTYPQNIIAGPSHALPVVEPSYPFPLMQLSKSSMVPSQEGFLQVSLEASLAIRKGKQVDSPERDLNIYPSNASITGGGNNGPEDDGGVTLSEKQSPDILEEDLATLVPNQGMQLPTTKLVGKTTALKYKEIILEWIANDEVVNIGVHGMGGIGKTTIFKHVYNQLLAEGKHFDKIIWVTVSKDGNITKVQSDLAKELDLNLQSEDDALRTAKLLFQELKKRKRVVFFFDDMWKEISLVEIGIPEPTQENGFKLILTTRLKEVCKRMGCHEDNTIKVEGLPKDEAWELLMNKIDCVLSPEVEEIAKMVANKCSGLPLAIITVGGAMRRNSDIDEWRVALNDLNLRDPSNRVMDMEDTVYECLKFSYDRLENEKQRKCFLFCALYPEDWKIVIRDLVDFWIMDGLVEGRNRQEELFKGKYILNRLKGHCLLETVDKVYDMEYDETMEGVKMHDSIRDMALRLTNKSFMVNGPNLKELTNEEEWERNKSFMVNGPNLKELPNEEEWERDLERVSFMKSNIPVFPTSPICPNLSTLIIRGGFLKSVTNDFFVHMKSLKILELEFHWNNLNSFPNSISDLVNLRGLRLETYGWLKKLPSLAKLVLLRKLDLSRTSIKELPEGMEMLVNLRHLNLRNFQLKERIPIGLISKFPLLEELYLGGINVDKLYEVGRGESFAKELLSLKHLENLSVTFHCVSDYVSYVGSPKFNGLKCFFLATGKALDYERGGPSRSTIKFVVDPSDEPTAFFILLNTRRLEIVAFDDVNRLNELAWLTKDVEELVSFRAEDCVNLECIWSSKEFSASSTCWLRRLEIVYISKCHNLYTIFEGIPNYRFGVVPVFCLKELHIYDGHNLKKVFPSSRLLQLLPNIERISIIMCPELEELIGDDDEEETETPIAIPRLKDLFISRLPKLKKICSSVMICDSLQTVRVKNCDELRRLPRLMDKEQLTLPPALLYVDGDRKWWDSLEWDPAYPKSILQPFLKDY